MAKKQYLTYPVKVILAWAESLGGNSDLTQWLYHNTFKELAIFTFAAYNKSEAKKWLAENGYAPLLACIQTAEGDEKAAAFLKASKFDVLFHLGKAGDGSKESYDWILQNCGKEFFYLAKKLEEAKDKIEERNRDPHYISFD